MNSMPNIQNFMNDFYSQNPKLTIGMLTTIPIMYAVKKWINGGICNVNRNVEGEIVVITGANTGIGYETAKVLASKGATIILACRDNERGQKAVQEISLKTHSKNIHFMQLDLADFQSIRSFAKEFQSKFNKLNMLINNAGVMAILDKRLTKDGNEMQMGTNHFGHFLLTNLLLDSLKKVKGARVINVSSRAHLRSNFDIDNLNSEKSYSAGTTYGNSKLANILFTKELQKRFDPSDLKAVCLHPGVVRTELIRYLTENIFIKTLIYGIYPLGYLLLKSPYYGAQTSLYCALEDYKKLVPGGYYSDCKIKTTLRAAENQETWSKLWEKSEKIVKL